MSLYPAETYRRFADAALTGLNPLSPEYKHWSRYFFHNALGTELDGAGRLTLPKEYREAAGIESRNVTIAGAGQCLELWDPERLRAFDAEQMEHPPDLPAALGHPA